MSNIPSTASWRTNAELIADVAKLGYIGPHCLDLSHNRGAFWTEWEPEELITNDIDHQWNTDFNHDVTLGCKDIWWKFYDTVVWDGPFRLNGTPDRGDFDKRYGTGQTTRWQDRMNDLGQGTITAVYATKPGGTILVKCQDQVVSGRKVWQTRILADVAEAHGATLIDWFTMVRPVRGQPPGRRQVHSRSNNSSLLVFRV